MRYTQGQIRDLVGLSVETLRAWRSVIPFLAERRGHSPIFTAGDMVAFAALAELVGTFGVRIGSIAEQAQTLFELCHTQSWITLEDCVVVIDAQSARLTSPTGQRSTAAQTAWTSPCGLFIARLRRKLSDVDQTEQGMLQFPPVAIGERR